MAAMRGSWVTKIRVVPRSRFMREQQLHNLLPGFAVQCAGGLVGQDDGRVIDQGAGDGHPLLLPARKLIGLMIDAVAQPHHVSAARAFSCGLLRVCPGVAHGQNHIGQGGLAWKQIEALEDKADLAVADRGELVIR